ncbi:hypothetical protein SIM91_44410 [Rhodococcus opacus]|uniref:hypothetical protein n=1 Tax=Rhodococcus opacus TaxID=37919 RepID=UPI000B19CE6D|nr:hypothetical protein [Rhodococcus opacus]MDX5970186.1 hypothetical protein [Rhodococcus opacus]NKY75144.1 hypothetical protein [Rhodococcus opacus]CAG7632818.1 hypothetical protein E143388_07437 [Rhodococcus opacus]
MSKPKELTTMNHEQMTQERREAFWRKYRWTPDLPPEQRKAIEQVWTDEKIEEAEALGF